MDLTRKFIVIGLLLLATLVTGFGKPHNIPLSGFHKLLALAWVIFTAILVFHVAWRTEPKTAFFCVIAVLGVSIVALIWSGSVLTMTQLDHTVWRILHRIATAIAVTASVLMARFLILSKP